MKYNQDNLRKIFQSKFDIKIWQEFLASFFQATELKTEPERIIETLDNERGYYLGTLDTSDSYRIGFFYYAVKNSDVSKRRVGLRNLVKSFVNPKWGEFDAALVVFEGEKAWRLSFVCDIKGEATAAKRFTFVLGEEGHYYNTPVERFLALQQSGISFSNIKEAFNVEALTKQFYRDLFDWYQWAVGEESGITFPSNSTGEEYDREKIDTKIIRLITRIMFVWFIKQKGLVPARIFDKNFLANILEDFNPLSKDDGSFYNAILQNLFFATLNRAIEDEDGKKRGFAQTTGSKDLTTLYRYKKMFKIAEDEIVDIFSEVPFLNGGLFECLDKTQTLDGVEKAFYYDGFTRNESKTSEGKFRNRAFIPNELFFKPETGLLSIFERYNFTIEENSPNEQQVALDPELLGKVFENLLGAYNPETKETARKESGSFYTPREIVNYMVDESLKAYLGSSDIVKALFSDDFIYHETSKAEYEKIAAKLKTVKVLDPACGSGAFPMGLLNRLVDILRKICPEESAYELKLSIIENCIYGCDIQSIAVQITKLRFFISLICDCERDPAKPNFGIPTLPNLETKFVAADSLIAKKKPEMQGSLFVNSEIEPTKKALAEVRHRHFFAKSTSAKRNLRDQDRTLREKLAQLLSENADFAPEDAKQLADWNPYDQNAVSPFFDSEWMFGVTDGFDIIIGNPPYIQLQKNDGELAKFYQNCDYKTFTRTGDIYCLFYELGWRVLKPMGHLCYITSNKWMRAGYGEKTRAFFARETNPVLLVDFAGVKIFESATVDANILLFGKSENQKKCKCAVTNKHSMDSFKKLSDFVEQQHTICDFSTSESWVVLSPIEQSIKRKIEAVGIPLRDWDIQINYGIKTGCNEAFIISEEKRAEILKNCQTDEERQRTADLIRPVLRGRDIKKYGYVDSGLYLINTHNGIKGKIPRIHIENYPAVKAHLDKYWNQLEKRADQGDTPYNLRNCAYLEDFEKPKIIWKRVGSLVRFSFDESGALALDSTCFASGRNLAFLCCVLNSDLGIYLLKDAPCTGTGDLLISVQSVEPIKIPVIRDDKFNKYLKIQCNAYSNLIQREINAEVSKLYGLSAEEQTFVSQFSAYFKREH